MMNKRPQKLGRGLGCGVVLWKHFLTSKGRVDCGRDFVIRGPVVQSVVSLTSSLRVISLTVLADSIYNVLIFLLKKCE